jgi:hypothetical protein
VKTATSVSAPHDRSSAIRAMTPCRMARGTSGGGPSAGTPRACRSVSRTSDHRWETGDSHLLSASPGRPGDRRPRRRHPGGCSPAGSDGAAPPGSPCERVVA